VDARFPQGETKETTIITRDTAGYVTKI